MTRFNYDPTPFAGGWTPPAASVVYGVERPEILINETFAYHDRRNQDLPVGGGSDPTWDSGQIPQSGAFFELYHPWTQGGTALPQSSPAELGAGGVELGRTTNMADPADQTDSDPVWRMVFKRDKTDPAFLRAVYFVDIVTAGRPSLTSDLAAGSDYFFTTLASKTVLPGEYAVIGPFGNAGLRGGSYETTFGRLQTSMDPLATDAELDMTRAIGLNHADDMVIRRDGLGGGSTEEAKVIVIDSSSSVPDRSLSLSDPNGGYTIGTPVGRAGDGWQIFLPLDEPLDMQPAMIGMNDNRQVCLLYTSPSPRD